MQKISPNSEIHLPAALAKIISGSDPEMNCRALFPYADLPLKLDMKSGKSPKGSACRLFGMIQGAIYSTCKACTLLKNSTWFINKLNDQLLNNKKVPA